jgi:hypothetical protein
MDAFTTHSVLTMQRLFGPQRRDPRDALLLLRTVRVLITRDGAC